MLKRIKIVLLLLFSLSLNAQQLPQYTQYMFNKIAINPGFAGAGNGICVGGLIRQQWVGFKETRTDENGVTKSFNVAPETYNVSIHSPIKALRGGLGATIIQDQIAYQKNITVNLMYAYQTSLGAGDLGLGFQLSIFNKTINFEDYHPEISGDPLLNDRGDESDMIFDAGIGLYYRIPDNYYLGLSVLQLLQSKKTDGTGAHLRRHINLLGGYEFAFPNTPGIDILPSILIQTDGTSVQYDLSTLIRFKDQFWGGLSYRYQDAVAVILGFEYKNFNIGYSYDINTSSIGSFGSHEIRIGYCFKIEVDKVKKVYRNTRFL